MNLRLSNEALSDEGDGYGYGYSYWHADGHAPYSMLQRKDYCTDCGDSVAVGVCMGERKSLYEQP